MRFLAFSSRNRKELLRDPISLIFGIGLPVLLLLVISLIERSVSGMAEIFSIENFAPGIAMFSLSFIALFLGMLLANDRSSSFLARLFASPLAASDYLLGYSLPLLPIALVQSAICFITAFFLGLPVSVNVLLTILVLIPVAILFIGIGLLLGSIFSNKQVSPICSIVVQVAALSSGMWFDLHQIGGAFKAFCYALPFAHSVDLAKITLAGGGFTAIYPHLLWAAGYAAVIFVLAVRAFKKRMKS